jgi:hypothetical protein
MLPKQEHEHLFPAFDVLELWAMRFCAKRAADVTLTPLLGPLSHEFAGIEMILQNTPL